jgi:hypothetical protein
LESLTKQVFIKRLIDFSVRITLFLEKILNAGVKVPLFRLSYIKVLWKDVALIF